MDPAPPAPLSLRATTRALLRSGAYGLLAGGALFLLTAADSLLLLGLRPDGPIRALRFLLLLAVTVAGTALFALFVGLFAALLDAARLLILAALRRLPRRLGPAVEQGASLVLGSLLVALPIDLLTGLSPRGPKAMLRAAATGYHLYVSPIPVIVAGFRPLYLLALAVLVGLLMGAGAALAAPRGPRTRGASVAIATILGAVVLYAYHYDSRPTYGHSEGTLHVPLLAGYTLLAVYAAAFAARASGGLTAEGALAPWLRRASMGLLSLAIAAMIFAQVGMNGSPTVKALFWNRSVIARRALEIGRSLVDRDRDGASPLFGGGDADDHDPSRGPSAREIPGNGADDNGIGGDLDPALLASAPRAPLPGEFVASATIDPAANPKEAPPGAVDLASPEATGKAAASAGENLPTVILISVDALRADRLSLYGNPRATSPNLARWASRGLVFSRAISQATNTGHSFCSLLRSSYGDAVVDPGVPTLTQLLAKAGYHRAFLNSRRLDDWLLQKRWQVYRSTMIDSFDVLHLAGGAWWNAEELTSGVISYVDRLPPDRAELLWVHYNDTHQPRVPRTTFGSADLDVYDAAVAFTDAQIGRLLDHLEGRGILKHAIVIVTADHGEGFFEHGTFDHSNKPYMDNDHVPLVILAPGVSPARIDAPVGLIDVAPTVLATAGLPVPDVYRGIDLLAAAKLPVFPSRPIVTEPPRNDPDAAFFAWALVEGHHKYLYDRKGMTEELYDLDADPTEQRDLSERDPERAARMRGTLGRMLDLESNRRPRPLR